MRETSLRPSTQKVSLPTAGFGGVSFLCPNKHALPGTLKQGSISLQTDAKSHLGCSPCPGFVACFILFLKPSFCSQDLFIHLTFPIGPFCVKDCFPSITVNESKQPITKGISEQEKTKAKSCSAFSVIQIMI